MCVCGFHCCIRGLALFVSPCEPVKRWNLSWMGDSKKKTPNPRSQENGKVSIPGHSHTMLSHFFHAHDDPKLFSYPLNAGCVLSLSLAILGDKHLRFFGSFFFNAWISQCNSFDSKEMHIKDLFLFTSFCFPHVSLQSLAD